MNGMTDAAADGIVYLDANVIIFGLEGEPSISTPIRELLNALRNFPRAGVTSEMTLAEVLIGPETERNPPLRRLYLELLVWSGYIDLRPIDRDILIESARLRAHHKTAHNKKLKLPDAIHLVTAIRTRCRYFLSADKEIIPPTHMMAIRPDGKGISDVLRALA
jgi:predicted nucleic acid-binding protein